MADLQSDYDELVKQHIEMEEQLDGMRVEISKVIGESSYFENAFRNAKREVEVWRSRAQGAQAEKDELLSILTEPRAGISSSELKRIAEATMALANLVRNISSQITTAMSTSEVETLKLQASTALLAITKTLPN